MNKKIFFDENNNWYKGNLHSHTTMSDGHLTPEESVQLYKNNGYHFICHSEHDLYTDRRSDFDQNGFIMLPGVEASAVMLGEEALVKLRGYTLEEIFHDANLQDILRNNYIKTHHIHGILGTKSMQEQAEKKIFSNGEKLEIPIYGENWNGKNAAQLLSDSLKERGMFTTYNHPTWSRVDMSEILGLNGIWAMEIYNFNTVNECREGENVILWDQCLRAGMHLNAFASDDNHNNGRFSDSCGGYVVVNTESLTHDNIVTALLEGKYYSSNQGPDIYQWGIEDGVVFVECEECERINFVCGGPIGSSATYIDLGQKGLRRAEHKLNGRESYVRVECVYKNGKTSWTNAYFL